MLETSLYMPGPPLWAIILGLLVISSFMAYTMWAIFYSSSIAILPNLLLFFIANMAGLIPLWILGIDFGVTICLLFGQPVIGYLYQHSYWGKHDASTLQERLRRADQNFPRT